MPTPAAPHNLAPQTPEVENQRSRLVKVGLLIRQCPGNASHAGIRNRRRFQFSTVPNEPHEPETAADAVYRRIVQRGLPLVVDLDDREQTAHVRSVPYCVPIIDASSLCALTAEWRVVFGREVSCPICHQLLTAEGEDA